MIGASSNYGEIKEPSASNKHPWFGGKFKNFVVFGDSYTDETRLDYFTTHNNTPPPVGLPLPESLDASDGGRVWPRYVSKYSGAKLYNYAIAGGICTTSIVPQARATPKDLYAAILETEIPTWLAESHLTSALSPHEKFYTGSADDTLYAMWIGVNDVGKKNIFIDSQTPGTSLTTFTDCVFTAFDSIYKNGGRKFVLMNVPPLELHPIYATPENMGVPPGSPDWPNKPSNLTEVSFKMYEYTRAVNEIIKFQVPFQQLVAKRYPGAKWAIYDVNSLFKDIHQSPGKYLNGTTPLNVLDYIHHCQAGGTNCTNLPGDPDSYMFYDSLHPSEQVHRIVAQNFMDVISGGSKFATYW
ncbi:carbohydrate esterase family 16 protein [Trichoderma virens Gv29-8]|uniref:Carbohydrate esterase family 16 protein n=1 Tax=Hypocrea virens (strain Gv29-8 / FGSC 10586) TaxID=413071 RepID=G9N8B7_HYPVG|nr:carbohydrate esterase family 16 protein [Trichoderma virens Gv29-8]EHK17225.1 carbohydrate esterase family 16 protein [Trichoderma virens Gv29-8]